jgi:hypothetical protein
LQNMKRIFLKICVVTFALLVISFIIWRVNLAHEVNTELQAIRVAGLPTSGAELNAYYPAVPDNENAALVMTQAFALMRNFPDSRSNEVARFKIPPRGQSLTAEQKQLLVGYVEMNSMALEKADEAIKLPKSRYPVDFTLNNDALLPHLPNLRKILKLAGFEIMTALQTQDSKRAADLILFQMTLCRTLDAEPLPISQLVRGEIMSAASQSVEYSLNLVAFDEATLLRTEKAFASTDENGISSIGFIGSRATTLPYFQTNWPAIYRVIYFSEGDSYLSSSAIFRGRFGWLTGLFERDEIFYLKAVQAAIDEIKSPFPQCLSAYSTMHETALKGHRRGYIFGPENLNGLRNALPDEAETATRVRITIAALDVEQFRLTHGRLPKNLNEFVPQFLSAVPVDPFDGQPLRYNRLAKGYVIYSVGRDGHDNNGHERPANTKSSDKTEYDITFTVER